MSASNVFFFPRGPLKVDEFTSNDTWDVPNGVNKIIVIGCGGGQGGSDVTESYPSDSTINNTYSGGCGAALVIRTLSVTPGDTYTVTIGAGGASSSDGSNSSFSGPGGTITMHGAGSQAGSSGLHASYEHYGTLGAFIPTGISNVNDNGWPIYNGVAAQGQNGYSAGTTNTSGSPPNVNYYGGGGAGPFGDGADGASGTGDSASSNTGAGGGGGGTAGGLGGSGRIIVIYAENNLT